MKYLIYSSDTCPKCAMLKKRMDAFGVDYVVETDLQPLKELGIYELPTVVVGGEILNFAKAWKRISEQNDIK